MSVGYELALKLMEIKLIKYIAFAFASGYYWQLSQVFGSAAAREEMPPHGSEKGSHWDLFTDDQNLFCSFALALLERVIAVKPANSGDERHFTDTFTLLFNDTDKSVWILWLMTGPCSYMQAEEMRKHEKVIEYVLCDSAIHLSIALTLHAINQWYIHKYRVEITWF